MDPPHAHWHLLVLLSAGMLAIMSVGAPGTQGVVTGKHAAGVATPNFAAVAAMTLGFNGAEHNGNGGMFFMGTKSMMFAAGWLPESTRFSGVTMSVDGPMPIVHINVAPLTTWIAMTGSFSLRSPGSRPGGSLPHPADQC